MTEYNTNDTDRESVKKKKEKIKINKMMKNYYSNGYLLENQALRNGFGKMIRAINQTNPKYTFGKEKRFFSVFKNDNLPYEHNTLENEKYGNINIAYHNKINNKIKGNLNGTYKHFDTCNNFNINPNLKDINFISSANNATDYYYVPPPTHYYKYSKSPKWGFSKSKRVLYDDKPKYEHYTLPFNKTNNIDNIKKTWRNRIIGGDIGLDERFIENRKLPVNLETPGPGRYNPRDLYFKYSHYPGGYMGMKLDCCETTKHKNLRNELNICLMGNEKMRKPIGTNKNFVFHKKIKFDLGRNNHLINSNKRKEYSLEKKENTFIKKFRDNFSLDEKKPIF